MLAVCRKRRRAVRRAEHLVALRFEADLRHLADHILVLGQQNALLTASCLRFRQHGCFAWRFPGGREEDLK